MPPRGPRKGKSGGNDAGTEEPAEVTNFHLDQRPIQPQTSEQDIGKETQRLDTLVAKCKAGVAWVNLLAIAKQLQFGEYNDRLENDNETNKLIASFKGSGIVAMKDTSAIPLILDLKRIQPELTLAKDFVEVDQVPELKLIDTQKIIVASGQHRLSALRRYNKSLQDELDALEKRWKKISGLKNPTQEHVELHNDLRAEIGAMKGLLQGMNKWGVIVYDKDKLLAGGDELACHLSRNNRLHEYNETEEEVLVTILRKIKNIYEESPENTRRSVAIKALEDIRIVQDKNARLQKVLHNDGLCLLLATRLLRLGPHFRRRHEFSVTWLSKSIDVCMGVFVSWVNTRIVTLKKLGSCDEFPDYKTVSGLLDGMDAGNEEARKKVTDLHASIKDSKEYEDDDLSIWAEVLETLDQHAKAAFQDVQDSIGEMTPDYITQLSTYQQNVVQSLQQIWGLNTRSKTADAEKLKHLDQVVARIAVFLSPVQGDPHAPEPLLGGFFMDYAWNCFSRIKLGIAETCRWFEGLLDSWNILHPKTHTMDDWSTVMFSNLKNDSRFSSVHDPGHNLVHIMWLYRDSLMMRLTNRMLQGKLKYQPRPKDKKELDKAYDALSAIEKVACSALLTFVKQKRLKKGAPSRDIANEPHSVAGIMVLHTTAWDWQKTGIKNSTRDIEPCLKAIAIERAYMQRYRPPLLKDPWVGTLRRLIEMSLIIHVKKRRVMQGASLVNLQEWVWCDELTLDACHADPKNVLDKIKDKGILKTQQMQERLGLESIDRDAINKLVAIVSNMACAKASLSSNASMSADVLTPLKGLVHGLELNSSRLRMRALNDDHAMMFDVSEDIDVLQITLPEGHVDENTTGHTIDQEQPESGIDKSTRKEHEVDTQSSPLHKGMPVPADGVSMTPAPPSTLTVGDSQQPITKPKPRPIPRKKRQPSPTPIVELLDSSASEDGGVEPEGHSDSLTTANDKSEVPVIDVAVSVSAHDTVPSAAIHPDVSGDPAIATVAAEATTSATVNVLSRTSPSPSASSFDFGTNDLTWFVKESANELQSTSQADNQDDTVVLKNNPTAVLAPTQPVINPPMPTTVVPAESSKRARSATGTSTSSSSSAHGSMPKKKARIMQTAEDEDE